VPDRTEDTVTKYRSYLRRALGGLTALVIGVVALFVAAPSSPASASEMACNYNDDFNACLRLDYQGYGWWSVHVGLDVRIRQTSAQQLIDCGVTFDAALYGDDGSDGDDDRIRLVTLRPGFPVASEAGLGAELFQVNVNDTELDEDDGQDELEVHVSYYDCRTGMRSRVFHTGILRGSYG
jgi:hypothetical protein